MQPAVVIAFGVLIVLVAVGIAVVVVRRRMTSHTPNATRGREAAFMAQALNDVTGIPAAAFEAAHPTHAHAAGVVALIPDPQAEPALPTTGIGRRAAPTSVTEHVRDTAAHLRQCATDIERMAAASAFDNTDPSDLLKAVRGRVSDAFADALSGLPRS